MLEGNPYIVIAQKARKRFRPKAIGNTPVEVYNTTTGEVTYAKQLVGQQQLYDSSDFIKFYQPDILCSLSQPAVIIFAYIATNLRFGGIVTIHPKEAAVFANYKNLSSISRAINELLQKDVIRKKDRNEYWVNPNIIYRGQRDEFMLKE